MDRVPRRRFLAGAAALLAAPNVPAQLVAGARRVGFLGLRVPEPLPLTPVQPLFKTLSAKLAAAGWEIGRNVELLRRFSHDLAGLSPLVAELTSKPVEVILVTSTAPAVAAARGTKTIPIVLLGATAYPIECGLIHSYARPGTNVTGVAWFQSIDVHAKLAQFVREILPSSRRLAWMVFPADLITVAGGEFSPKEYYAKVAKSLGFEFHYYECRHPQDIDAAFAAARQWGAHAAIVEPASLSYFEAKRIGDLAKLARLPTFCGQTQNAIGGGLLAYSPIQLELWKEAVPYIDRILRGASPAELPVVMPNRLELTLNMDTARSIGVTFPQSILLRVDRLIE